MKPYLMICCLAWLPCSLFGQNRYDIIIDEIMADPSPQNGLPNNEWIELKNTSPFPVNIHNWRIGDAGSQSGPMPAFLLQPDSFVIICPVNAVANMAVFGTALGVTSFPSLDNDGDQLYVKNAAGMVMHAVGYSLSWYRNELKKDGGWTLEMTDTKSPCTAAANWKASENSAGGTPGKRNSVESTIHDDAGPLLKQAHTNGSTTITLVFDEPLDSLQAASVSNYSIDGGMTINDAIPIAPVFNHVQLKTASSLLPGIIYTVTASHIADCKGNNTGTTSTKTGLPADPMAGQWIINEILFNPRPNGYDYVELYNNSSNIFDASRLYIANRNSNGVAGSIKQLATTPFYVFPGEYVAITENADNLSLNYLVRNPATILVVPSLPSFPDDEGTVIAMNAQGQVTDEVDYKDDWHFKLLTNSEGVSLERIDPSALSQDAFNWHSAASTAGYGTPGYRNSQYRQPPGMVAAIDITPKIFSPDNDGIDDIATIQYKMEVPGFVANITIFDAAGRPVRNLVRNNTLALSGYWNWDGLDDRGRRLAAGTYIFFTEIFNLQGKKSQFKNTIVLARKLN